MREKGLVLFSSWLESLEIGAGEPRLEVAGGITSSLWMEVEKAKAGSGATHGGQLS